MEILLRLLHERLPKYNRSIDLNKKFGEKIYIMSCYLLKNNNKNIENNGKGNLYTKTVLKNCD